MTLVLTHKTKQYSRLTGCFFIIILLCFNIASNAENEKILFAPEPTIPCSDEPTDMTIAYGNKISCEINPETDIDIFRFTGTTGEFIHIQGSNNDKSYCLDLYRPDSTQKSWDCGNLAEIQTTLDQTGTYTLVVFDLDCDQVQSYTIILQCIVGEPCFSTAGFANTFGFNKGNSLDTLSSGGASVAGITSTYGAGMKDVALLQIDSIGAIVSRRTYGGTNDDIASSIVS